MNAPQRLSQSDGPPIFSPGCYIPNYLLGQFYFILRLNWGMSGGMSNNCGPSWGPSNIRIVTFPMELLTFPTSPMISSATEKNHLNDKPVETCIYSISVSISISMYLYIYIFFICYRTFVWSHCAINRKTST